MLDSIGENRAVLEQNPGARDALRTVRRGFHTLKGSGRMVGLTELGELAYDAEKIENRLLEEDRAVTPAVVAMIAVAEKNFRHWVTVLRRDGRVHPMPPSLSRQSARSKQSSMRVARKRRKRRLPVGTPPVPEGAGCFSPFRRVMASADILPITHRRRRRRSSWLNWEATSASAPEVVAVDEAADIDEGAGRNHHRGSGDRPR